VTMAVCCTNRSLNFYNVLADTATAVC